MNPALPQSLRPLSDAVAGAAALEWQNETGVSRHHIAPGKPRENGAFTACLTAF